jgi:hypothetical protein
MKGVHDMAAVASVSATSLAKKTRGYKQIGHQPGLLDQPQQLKKVSGLATEVSSEDVVVPGEGQDALTDPDETYQSSEVGSLRKDFVDFKSTTESYLRRLDKTLKTIDARLRTMEGQPVPMIEQGKVTSHRRVISSGMTSPPIAVYTPVPGPAPPKTTLVDVSFVVKARYTASPAVQHSVISKYIGKDVADSVALPISRELWNVKGFESLFN